MINGKSVLAVIPARMGSKGLPGKNAKEMCGKSLVEWAAAKALSSHLLDTIVLSTDSVDLREAALTIGIQAPFLRPARLATDSATTLDVVRHALDYYDEEHGSTFDYTVLLEPTSPLREDDDVDLMLKKLDSMSASFDAIISVGRTAQSPSVLKRLSGPRVERFIPETRITTRRQDDEAAFFPFGVAYIVKTPVLLAEGTFYPKRTTWFEIKRYQEYEIDDLYDFLCVERVMQHQWGLS
jgi:CMP-N,N'-diacetyllegionaminic acid synthase